MLVEPSSVAYARPLPCGTVEHEDGTITEGCSSESQNNGVEGSVSEYEAHACCNVGWMALDLEAAINKYGEYSEENTFGVINPKNWLESLSENGFDVFIVVYLAVLLLAYHYLLRWYINIKFKEIEKGISIINETINDYLDEVEG